MAFAQPIAKAEVGQKMANMLDAPCDDTFAMD